MLLKILYIYDQSTLQIQGLYRVFYSMSIFCNCFKTLILRFVLKLDKILPINISKSMINQSFYALRKHKLVCYGKQITFQKMSLNINVIYFTFPYRTSNDHKFMISVYILLCFLYMVININIFICSEKKYIHIIILYHV